MPSVQSCLTQIRDLLSLDGDFGQQCRTAADLCDLLADGEILCRILCVLSAGAISPDDEGTVSFYSENSQLLARQNVHFFLAKCTEHFGMQREALFEPEDLLEMRRPEQVIAGLQEVLRLPRERLNSASRRSEAATSEYATPQEEVSILEGVISEICESERRLAGKMETLLLFKRELSGLLSEWSSDLVATTFKYAEDLLKVHEDFYAQLSCLSELGPAQFCSGLGELFESMKSELAVYAKYFSHYPLAKAKLESEFQAAPQLRRQLHLLEGHFKVDSFSVLYDAPLRQLFNYTMLFERLLGAAAKELPDTDAAADSVEAALSDCKRLLSHFNECKRNSEKASATQLLLQRVARLPEELANLEEVGLHRADGTFKMKRDQEAARDCFCLLTDRQLIVTRAARGAKDAQMDFLFSLPITEDLALEYSGAVLKLQGRSCLLAFTKAADTKKTMDVCRWGQLLSQAIAFNFPDGWNSNCHRFQLASFPGDSACSRCGDALTGYAFQGYHCEHCGQQLDRKCLQVIVRLRPKSFPGADRPAASVECEFFHGCLDRGAAERLLRRAGASGSFLLRENANKALLVLSIHWDGVVFHLIVQQKVQEDSMGSPPQYALEKCNVWHASLDKLIEHYSTNQISVRGVVNVTLGNGIPGSKYLNC